MNPDERSLRLAITRAAAWLRRQPGLPPLEARDAAGATVRCERLPYAAAAAAWLSRRAAPLAVPDSRVADWLKDACDADGWVRFFGPTHPDLIGPDLDDTALIWSERRALSGDLPPAALLAAVEAARREGGAFDTWPSPPEDGPRSEIDAVVHVNVIAWLATLGHVEPDPWLAARLADPTRPSEGTPYYPDPAALSVFVRRAADLGAGHAPALLQNIDTRTLLSTCALAGPGAAGRAIAASALLTLQRPDGSFPWAPVFVGGPRTGFPTGEVLTHPAFGGPVLSTALVVDALARTLGLTLPPLPLARRVAPAPPPAAADWPLLAGPLDPDHTLAARELASALRPFLVGPHGELPLDIGAALPGQPAFCARGPWAVSYRGPRPPTAAEAHALTTLAERLAERLPHGPPLPRAEPDPASAPADLNADLRADLNARIASADPHAGPLRIDLPPDAMAPSAAPALAVALATARRHGLRLELSGLAHCALPSDEAWLVSTPPVRPLAAPCHRCVRAPICPGPGPHPLRPRTSDTPWLPLDRLAASWRAHSATPSAALWSPYARALHDLGRGPLLGDTLWSPTLAVDVSDGRLAPTWRLAAFYGRRDGTRAPGRAIVDALPELCAPPDDRTVCLTDAPALRDALAPAAARLPAYPGLQIDPATTAPTTSVSVYLDTDHLAAADACAEARALAARLGLTLTLPASPPRLLGLSAHLDTTGRATLDLYARLDAHTPHAWSPPPGSPAAATPHAVATLRVTAAAPPTVRKWDIPFWPYAVDDAAVISALRLSDSSGASTLNALLASPDFTLHPTTLGVRPDGRRVYFRVC